MKRIAMFMMMAAFAAMAACSSDTTEIGWKNNEISGENINEIVWVAEDITWIKGDTNIPTSGYANGEITEQKEVKPGTSQVWAALWDGSGYASGDAKLETGNNSYTIHEGESVIVTINQIE